MHRLQTGYESDCRAAVDEGAEVSDSSSLRHASGPAIELLGRWLELSELERRTFLALIRELRVSSDLVETSTLDLSNRFRKLASIAQTQMGRVETITSIARSIDVRGEAVPLDAAMRSVEDVLIKVIDTILSVSKHAMRMVFVLEDVTRDLAGSEQCLVQIETINTQTRFLALNAAIEAERSGEAGAAFGVIAREMKDLSHATATTSKDVHDRIAAIARGVRSGHAVLQEIATLDLSEHIMAKERIDDLLAGIIAQNQAFTTVLADTMQSSSEMAGTIGLMITGMQFQDRTKQHIAQITDALGVLEDATQSMQCATRAAFPSLFEVGSIDEAWLHRMVSMQTLGAVKQRMLTQLLTDVENDGGGIHGASEPDDDIELF